VLTAAHTPLFWRYDLDPATNPLLMERLGINAAFNVGAMEWNGNVVLMARVEGVDRKSFFASGGKRQRTRRVPLLGLPGGNARDGGAGDMSTTCG